MVEEVQSLIASGVSKKWLQSIGLEYRYVVDLLDGKLTESEFNSQLKTAIRRFAKRQVTWWRHHGNVEWFNPTDRQTILQRIAQDIAP